MGMKFLRRVASIIALSAGLMLQGVTTDAAESQASQERVVVSWGGGQWRKRDLKLWTLEDAEKLKVRVQNEWDPVLRKISRFEGVRLRELVERSMDQMSAQEKAQVDLIVLKNSNEEEVALPRWLMNKYSILLAFTRNSKRLDENGPFYVVVPWTSQARIKKEVLPLGKYFFGNVVRVELTNFRKYYSDDLFVSNRSDPVVMRGQKRFVQSCIPCHQTKEIYQIRKMHKLIESADLMQSKHKNINGFSSLDQNEHRALVRYISQILKKRRSSKPFWSFL